MAAETRNDDAKVLPAADSQNADDPRATQVAQGIGADEETSDEIPFDSAGLPDGFLEDLADLPDLSDLADLGGGLLTLETGAGADLQGGGSGEYRELLENEDDDSLSGAAPLDDGNDVSVPGSSTAAFGSSSFSATRAAPAEQEAAKVYNEIRGTARHDRLVGGEEADHIVGLAGHDRLYGGAEGDWLQGDAGHDRLYGGAGDDKLVGGAGNDRLFGQAGADSFDGGAGNDFLYVDADDRSIDGGDGYDRVYVQGKAGVTLDLADANVEFAYGGYGDDSFDASGQTAAVHLYGGHGGDDSLAGGAGRDYLNGQNGNDSLSGGGGNDRLYGQDGHDKLLGGEGNDTLHGGSGADSLFGGAGNDRLYFDGEDKVVDGGEGTDWAYVSTKAGAELDLAAGNIEHAYGHHGDDVLDASGLKTATRLYGNHGNDGLIGGAGNDRLYGQGGNDKISGGAGNDILHGGAGADGLFGGAGNDRLYIDGEDKAVDGGSGVDWAYVTTKAGVKLDLAASNIEHARGHHGSDVLDASGLKTSSVLYGNHGDDGLIGGAGNDRLYGQGGNDKISGGDGNDILHGGAGADGLFGGAGNDRLYMDGADKAVDGGSGIDWAYIQGSTGASLNLAKSNIEHASGGHGDDSLDASGLKTDTRLYGGQGDDGLVGGSGNDRLYGHAGNDKILGGGGNDWLYGQAGDDGLYGGEGNDWLLGYDGNDGLFGGDGNDRLYGHAGDDKMLGEAGNDRLYGGDGADSLIGGEGNDSLVGNAGADSFLFALSYNRDASEVTGPGADRIVDFSAKEGDKLVLTELIDVTRDREVNLDDLLALEADGRLTVSESGKNVVVSFNGGGSISLDGLATGSIDSVQDLIDSGANIVV